MVFVFLRFRRDATTGSADRAFFPAYWYEPARERERERERERDRERQRDRERETERETERDWHLDTQNR
jgi:hypothetical protein